MAYVEDDALTKSLKSLADYHKNLCVEAYTEAERRKRELPLTRFDSKLIPVIVNSFWKPRLMFDYVSTFLKIKGELINEELAINTLSGAIRTAHTFIEFIFADRSILLDFDIVDLASIYDGEEHVKLPRKETFSQEEKEDCLKRMNGLLASRGKGLSLIEGVLIPLSRMKEIEDAQKVLNYSINGKKSQRIPNDSSCLCAYCQTQPGMLHLPGCLLERCPFCGEPAARCNCKSELIPA